MSRTDKHRPYWVRMEDPYNRRYVEEAHDHRSTDCDFDGTSSCWNRGSIPAKRGTPAYTEFWKRERQRCVVKPIGGWAGYGELLASNRCGSWCIVCDPDAGGKGSRRTAWRALARNALKSHIEDIDDMEELTTNARYLRIFRGQHW